MVWPTGPTADYHNHEHEHYQACQVGNQVEQIAAMTYYREC